MPFRHSKLIACEIPWSLPGLILRLRPANERWRYFVATDICICKQGHPSLVQIMACHLFGTKALIHVNFSKNICTTVDKSEDLSKILKTDRNIFL